VSVIIFQVIELTFREHDYYNIYNKWLEMMKKSKLKQIIKEEIHKELLESQTKNFLNSWEEKSKEFTKSIENLKLAYKKEHGL